jgi:hypothetical protein
MTMPITGYHADDLEFHAEHEGVDKIQQAVEKGSGQGNHGVIQYFGAASRAESCEAGTSGVVFQYVDLEARVGKTTVVQASTQPKASFGFLVPLLLRLSRLSPETSRPPHVAFPVTFPQLLSSGNWNLAFGISCLVVMAAVRGAKPSVAKSVRHLAVNFFTTGESGMLTHGMRIRERLIVRLALNEKISALL